MKEFASEHRAEDLVDRQKYEVLEALIDRDGRQIGYWIANELLFNPQRERAILAGPPSAGKTTRLAQTVEAIREAAEIIGIGLKLYVVKYDDVLGYEQRRQNSLEISEDEGFNYELFRAFTNPENFPDPFQPVIIGPEPENGQRKTIHLNELPAVGSKLPKNRGVSCFETFTYLTRNNFPAPDQIIYEVTFPESRIIRRANDLRAKVEEVHSSRVIDILKAHNFILPEKYDQANWQTKRAIKDKIDRMARSYHIAAINSEIVSESYDFFKDNSFPNIEIPDSLEPAESSEYVSYAGTKRTTLKRNVAYYEHKLARQYKLSPEDFKVAILTYIDGPIHWDPLI